MRVEIIRQHKECPQLYSDFLLRYGGKNIYGRPNFRLVWGPSATRKIWGQMEGSYCGQHTVLTYGEAPLWHLEMWKPAELFGTPEQWYMDSYNPETGLHVCGDYPFQGDYCHHSKQNNLNYRILENLLPKIYEARGITFAQRKRIIQERELAAKKERMRIIHDAYVNSTPAFGGVAGTYESNREAWMQRIIEKQAGMRLSAEEIKRRMGTGHTQVN
jgi:hypothetical protein